MKTIALIVAGGESKRFGGEIPKQFRYISGKPLLSWTIQKFEQAATIDQIVIVVAEDYLLYTSEKVVDSYNFRKVFKIVKGGATR
ncbi:MAG: NTP transferase domain-containing protein, partial [FCB group bacterium]|nr:NTP transferase domain-containing protein [FCB group bacterium]